MGRKVKVLCKNKAYYGDRLRPEGSIIVFDMDHCGTKMVDGKKVQRTDLPKWAQYANPQDEERHGEPVQREQNTTTLHALAEGTKSKLAKPATAQEVPVDEVPVPDAGAEVPEVKAEEAKKEEWGIPAVEQPGEIANVN